MSARPSLRRRVDRRLVSGVVGGIADRLNAPAGFLRVVLFYASFYFGWLIAVYAIATLLLPPRGRNRPGWDNLLVLGRLGVLFVVPWLLVGGEIPLGDTSAATELWVPLTGLMLVGLTVMLVSAYPTGPTEAQARSRVLASAVVALFAAAIGLGMLIAPDLRWDRAVPAGALLAGLALLAGVRLGRWRPLVAPAVLVTVIAAVWVASDVRLEGGFGDRRVRASATRPPPPQHVGIGDLTVDLGPLRRSSVTFRASVGVGDLRVRVPRHAIVSLDGYVGQGTLDTLSIEAGFGLSVNDDNAEVAPDLNPTWRGRRPLVRLVVDVGIGRLHVRRVGTGAGF